MTGRRVLPDANFLLCALLARGRPDALIPRLVQFGLAGGYTIVVSDTAVEEARSVLLRPWFAARFGPRAIETIVNVLRVNGIVALVPAPPIPRCCRDPRDDYLIAEALASGATHLLTGDRDLLALNDAGFPFGIVTPAELAAAPGITGA